MEENHGRKFLFLKKDFNHLVTKCGSFISGLPPSLRAFIRASFCLNDQVNVASDEVMMAQFEREGKGIKNLTVGAPEGRKTRPGNSRGVGGENWMKGKG